MATSPVSGPSSKQPLGTTDISEEGKTFVSLVHEGKKVSVRGDADVLAKQHADKFEARTDQWKSQRGKYGF